MRDPSGGTAREDRTVCSLSGLTWRLPNTTGAHRARGTACGVWGWSQGCSPDSRGWRWSRAQPPCLALQGRGGPSRAEHEADPGVCPGGSRGCGVAGGSAGAAGNWEGRPRAPGELAPQKHRCHSDFGSSGPWAGSFPSPSLGVLSESGEDGWAPPLAALLWGLPGQALLSCSSLTVTPGDQRALQIEV